VAQVEDLHKANDGAQWTALWAPHLPDAAETRCFLRDAAVAFPPHAFILPDYDPPANRLIVPLCLACRDLPLMVRYHRGLRLVKAMYKARFGKHLQLDFHPSRHPQ